MAVADAAATARPPARVFLLDRDGVVNVDVGAPGVVKEDDLKLLPGAADAIRRLNLAGHRVVIVTNQTAVRKGLLSEDGLDVIHRRMASLLLGTAGARVDEVIFATEAPRLKPEPAMLLEALDSCGAGAECGVMIGDKISDLEAAARAGVRALLVTSSHHGLAAKQRLDAGELVCGLRVDIHDDLAAAVDAELADSGTS